VHEAAIAGGRKCMKKKTVRRRVAARCTLFSIALFTLVFAQVQAMTAELAGNVDGASQAEMSQTTQPATTSAEDLAKKLQNPVAALISVPFQSNFDFGLGPSHTGWRYAERAAGNTDFVDQGLESHLPHHSAGDFPDGSVFRDRKSVV
jgi:hypothetical protein